ncbi:class I SAM-dependent methyltransferase [Lichenifustis flavocetrariae]|uniref:Methyltransferase n=1 Tax=Lichenifustis flavocetrariae TaxID=2949735 RepID=A0AA42CJP3_9HYPH|nr:methyltransferase [Lichenifustis flavocetrariae]MCW6509768.1 methyltransferase [Lichenifustis flavocetrariae]
MTTTITGRRSRAAALVLAFTLAGIGAGPARAQGVDAPRLQALVDGPQRQPANRARDPYRHPIEDLTFLGITPSDTVVEILPGGVGYWTEILAPYLKDGGRYIAANPPKTDTSEEAVKGNAALAAKIASDPADYAKVDTADFVHDGNIVPSGTADAVLTFRNVHNWMADGSAPAVFAAFFRALKPGGILGVEEHRGRSDQPQDPLAKSGYVRQDAVIALAEQAGFRLAATSEANANPKDTKDYPAGVWTLPPTYRLKDVDRATYTAIGESDRMLLRFTKPKS